MSVACFNLPPIGNGVPCAHQTKWNCDRGRKGGCLFYSCIQITQFKVKWSNHLKWFIGQLEVCRAQGSVIPAERRIDLIWNQRNSIDFNHFQNQHHSILSSTHSPQRNIHDLCHTNFHHQSDYGNRFVCAHILFLIVAIK